MSRHQPTICICGGGNLGHTLAGYIAAKQTYRVNLLTGCPEAWDRQLVITDCRGRQLTGRLSAVSDRPEDVIPGSDFVLLCLPGYAIEEELKKIRPYLQEGANVGSVVSSTGFFFFAKQLLPPTVAVFGFQRVPFISRIDTYGHTASLLGYKKELNIAVENSAEPAVVAGILSDLLDTPIVIADHFLEVSLSNSNPLLHTSRLYNLFSDYREGMSYEHPILFYEGWTDEDSRLLVTCDEEFFRILERLPIRPGSITPILAYYECTDAEALTRKIRSIEAFKGLPAPLRLTEEQTYVPDFHNRYFREDFTFGLSILHQIAARVHVACPAMTQILDWAGRFVPNIHTDFPITF